MLGCVNCATLTAANKSKNVALLPDITDDDEPAAARSPFLSPRAKVG